MKIENEIHARSPRQTRPRGSVLFMGLMFVVIATAIMLSVCSATFTNANMTTDQLSREESYFAARGFNELLVSDIEWGHYTSGVPDLRTFLAQRYPTQWSTMPPGYDKIADSMRTTAFPTVLVADLSDVYKNVSMGTMMPGRAKIYRHDRDDNVNGIKYSDFLVVTEAMRNVGFNGTDVQKKLKNPLDSTVANVVVGEDASWFAAAISPQNPPQFSGFDYAILTKNLTCTLCHMKVQDLSRSKNTNSALYNSYARVKVGTTQFMATRPGSSASNIEGALYHRGKLEDEQGGTALSPAQFAASTNTSTKFNATSPVTVYQNSSSGATQSASFVNQTTGTPDPITGAVSTPPPTGGNLYLNYPLSAMGQTDGILPGSSDFPAPFTDGLTTVAPNGTNVGNNRVDQGEIDLTVAKYRDSPANSGAKISGGNITAFTRIEDGGTPYAGTTLPNSGSDTITTQGVKSNYIMTGTQANPIKVDGTMVIQGDVIVNGYVEGAGQIYATGNIYVPGDVVYNNKTDPVSGAEIFGQNNSNGTNLLGLIAGGNIVVGDYLSGVTHWDSSKTDFVKPNYTGTAAAGQPDPGINIPYWSTGSGASMVEHGTQNPYTDLAGMGSITNKAGATVGNSNMANFTVEQLSVFNREELIKSSPLLPTGNNIQTATNYNGANPYYDANHVPRFYTMYPDNYNPYNKDALLSGSATNTYGTTSWSAATSAFKTDPTSTKKAHSPVPLFVNNSSPWDPSKNRFATAGDPHTYNTLSELSDIPSGKVNMLDKANFISIHPNWISPDNMLKILSDTEHKRTDGVARRIDGLLYTNNAIFAIERKQTNYFNGTSWSKVGTRSHGQLVVNGAMIAPDLGVLVTGDSNPSFLVNYDARVKQFLPITSASSAIWGFGRQGFLHGSGLLP